MNQLAQHTSNIDYSLLDRNQPMRILAVEDDIVSMGFLQAQIDALGHHSIPAENGQDALDILRSKKEEIDVILMDREMPIMNGLTAVQRIKDDPTMRSIPIIMVTGADSAREMSEGMDAGVFYYLTKPVDEDMLRSVLSAAIRESNQSRTLSSELGKHKASFNLIESCKFTFSTLAEAESLAAFMANCFPDPMRVLAGLGALMMNAIEHGSLGIGYERKGELIARGIWRSEVERMQHLEEFEDRRVTATIAKKDDGIYVIIEDMGAGFDWKDFIQIDPARAGDSHGRGIAQAASSSFDRLTYNEAGNKAVGFVSHIKQLEW